MAEPAGRQKTSACMRTQQPSRASSGSRVALSQRVYQMRIGAGLAPAVLRAAGARSPTREIMEQGLPPFAGLLNRPKLIISAGAVLALAAGAMSAHQLRHREVAKVEAPDTRRVVVAARAIARGEPIEPQAVKEVELPVVAAPSGAAESVAAVEGKLARTRIYPDDVLTQAKLLETYASSALSGLLPMGRRAISIKVNEVTGISGFVGPGSHVDVLLSVAATDSEPAQTVTVLQDAEVLAIDQATGLRDGQPVLVDAVTLNVTPKQAERLAVAVRSGRLQLTLRNDRDDENTWSSGVTLPEIAGASAPKTSGTSIELIRAGQRTTVIF